MAIPDDSTPKTKTCSKCKEIKQLLSFSKRKISLDGYNNRCRSCCKPSKEAQKIARDKYRSNPDNIKKENEASRKYHAKHKEQSSALARAWRAKNAERYRATITSYLLVNKKKIKAVRDRYRLENKDAIKAKRREYYLKHRDKNIMVAKAWCVTNPEKSAARTAKRRAIIKNAIPPWETETDRIKIKMLYNISKVIQNCTGVNMHVDHIIPLKSKVVCGFHTPDNMRVIPAYDNISKSNNFTPTWSIAS